MKQIVRMRFGSALYGTSTPQSDVDYKSVFIPAGRDILMQSVNNSFTTAREKEHGEKNLPGETEEASYSVQRYLQLLAQGDIMAIDMLFAPDWAMPESEPATGIWREIQRAKDKLVTKDIASTLKYCRDQAAKYGIKGSRLAAARAALRLLEGPLASRNQASRLEVLSSIIIGITAEHEHMAIVVEERTKIQLWEVCGKKMPFSSSIQSARDVMQRLVDAYGERAKQAENNEGVDWKALSHAVRVGYQARDLLSGGEIYFPLAVAPELLEIKQGKWEYKRVAALIERLMEEVEMSAVISDLRATPDQAWIDDFVMRCHYAAVTDWARGYERP